MAGSGSGLEEGEGGSYCEQRKLLIMKECFPPTTKAVPAGTITITHIVCCSSVAKATTDERILEVVVAIVVVGVAVGAAVAVAVAAAGLQLLQQQRQQQLRGALSFGGATAASTV